MFSVLERIQEDTVFMCEYLVKKNELMVNFKTGIIEEMTKCKESRKKGEKHQTDYLENGDANEIIRLAQDVTLNTFGHNSH